MRKKINRFCLGVILLPFLFQSSELYSQESLLNKYIEEGLNSNLVLQQKNIDVKKAWYALKNAESLFLPVVSFQSSYQTGAGGRSISLPVGDLMNPVYSTLNQLIGSEKFPAIKNVNQDFLPNQFYDARIRTTVPIINTDMNYNRKIEQQKVELEKIDVDVYKHELTRNIKVAYYTYFSAVKVIAIYKSAFDLSNENIRTNERLLQNGKGLASYLLRAKSEQETIQSKITEAEKSAENGLLYFNFLLNRNAKDRIDVTPDLKKEFTEAVSMIQTEPDVTNRPELNAFRKLINLHNTVIEMNRKYWVPKLSGFVDLGSQASRFGFNSQSRYYNTGIQLEIPLFTGKRNLIKIQEAQLNKRYASLGYDYTSQQLAFMAATIKNNLIAAYQTYQSSLKSAESAASYQRLIERGFKEGIHTFIEDIDARSLLTAAQLQVNISMYKVLIEAANLERETGTFNQ